MPVKNLLIALAWSFLIACSNETGSIKKNLTDNPPVNLVPVADERTACLLAEIAYCDDQHAAVEKYMPGWKVVWEGKEFGGNHCFVASNDSIYGMGIRGSLISFSYSAFQNWIYQDLNIASIENWTYTNDSSKAKISEGAMLGWKNLTTMVDKNTGKTLIDFFDKVAKPNVPVMIAGHSLGGNLSTVFGSWLYQHYKSAGKNPSLINVMTFAAPAAGNNAFASDFNKKFPNSVRYENSNDIVPKFPCRSGIGSLNALFKKGPDASKIMVGYKSMNVSLSKVFDLMNTALLILEFKNDKYVQTNGSGKVIDVELSGKYSGDDINAWFSEAGYHHSMGVYASYLKVPVVDCMK